MVNLTKPVMGGIEFKDFYRRPNSYHLHIETVILDKTTAPAEPCLYQLNDTQNLNCEHPVFYRLGTITEINTHKKIITLDDGTLITYDHLIIASGPQNLWHTSTPTHEFAGGIHTLSEALRLQDKKPRTPPAVKKKIRTSKRSTFKKHVMPIPENAEEQLLPSRSPKRVYQVQL